MHIAAESKPCEHASPVWGPQMNEKNWLSAHPCTGIELGSRKRPLPGRTQVGRSQQSVVHFAHCWGYASPVVGGVGGTMPIAGVSKPYEQKIIDKS